MKEIAINGRLREKNGIYHVVLYWKEGDKQKSKSFTTKLEASLKANKKKATLILVEKIKEYTEIVNSKFDKNKIKFLEFFYESIKKSRNFIEKNTYKAYTGAYYIIELYFTTHKKSKIYLKDISVSDINDFYYYLSSERKVTNNTIRHYHVLINKVLKEAYNSDLIEKNIMDKVICPKVQQYRSEYFTKEEIELFLYTIRGHKFELELNLAIFYGLRRSEVIALQEKAIDFNRKTIFISSTVFEDGSKVVVKSRTKNKSSTRILPLLPNIENLVKKRIEDIEKNKKFFLNSYNREYLGFICVTERGDILKPDRLSQNFKSILKKHKFKEIRFHDLRHSCATLLYNYGMQLKDIQVWLGHSTISTTANIYSHFDFSQKEKISEKLIEIFKK